VEAFGDLAEGAAACPPGCDHLNPGAPADGDCALDEWAKEHGAHARLDSLRRLLRSRESGDTPSPGHVRADSGELTRDT